MSRLWLFVAGALAVAVIFFSCGPVSHKEQVKFDLYYVAGEELYAARCANCHQASGDGLGLVYPPLKRSDFMDRNPEKVICLIKNGIKGSLTVNGEEFNQPMPGRPELTDLELAELLTYIYNNWDHRAGIIEVEQVSRALRKCEP